MMNNLFGFRNLTDENQQKKWFDFAEVAEGIFYFEAGEKGT